MPHRLAGFPESSVINQAPHRLAGFPKSSVINQAPHRLAGFPESSVGMPDVSGRSSLAPTAICLTFGSAPHTSRPRHATWHRAPPPHTPPCTITTPTTTHTTTHHHHTHHCATLCHAMPCRVTCWFTFEGHDRVLGVWHWALRRAFRICGLGYSS